jgi:hypothetical protein
LFESQGKERTFRAIKERSEFRRRRIGFLVFRRWRRIATIMFTRWTKMVPLPWLYSSPVGTLPTLFLHTCDNTPEYPGSSTQTKHIK